MKKLTLITSAAALVMAFAPVAHADFGALTQMSMPTAPAYTTGLVLGVHPQATDAPSLVNEPAAITDGYDATSGVAALGATDAQPIDATDMPAAGSFDDSNMPTPAITSNNDMPAYGSFGGGSVNPSVVTTTQTFQTAPVPDMTPSVQTNSSSGSSGHKTYGGKIKTAPQPVTTTLSEMAQVKNTYAPIPVMTEDTIVSLPGSDTEDYAASVRNIGIAVNLAGVLTIIVAFMAVVVGYREYQARKRNQATAFRTQEIARMTA